MIWYAYFIHWFQGEMSPDEETIVKKAAKKKEKKKKKEPGTYIDIGLWNWYEIRKLFNERKWEKQRYKDIEHKRKNIYLK